VSRISQHRRRIAYIGGRHRETGKGKRKKGRGGKDIFDEKFCSPRCLMGIMLPMTILMIWAPPHPCPKFQPPPLPSGPNPAEQQEQPHSICCSKRMRIVIDCSPPHPHKKAATFQKEKNSLDSINTQFLS